MQSVPGAPGPTAGHRGSDALSPGGRAELPRGECGGGGPRRPLGAATGPNLVAAELADPTPLARGPWRGSPGPRHPASGLETPKHELAQGPEGQPLEPAWTPPADPEARAGEWAGQAAVCGQEGEHLGPGVTHRTAAARAAPPTPGSTPLKKIREKTQSFATPQLDSGPRDSLRLGHTGVFIKGLEVANTTVASEKQPPLRPRAESPRLPRNRSLSSPSRIHPSEEDGKGRAGR